MTNQDRQPVLETMSSSTSEPLLPGDKIHPISKHVLWLGDKKVEDGFIWLPVFGLIVTVLLGFIFPQKHGAPWDFFGSWAVIGFVAYSFVVLSAAPLFRWLSRAESYYGDDDMITDEHMGQEDDNG